VERELSGVRHLADDIRRELNLLRHQIAPPAEPVKIMGMSVNQVLVAAAILAVILVCLTAMVTSGHEETAVKVLDAAAKIGGG
jgi:hypothetical protein